MKLFKSPKFLIFIIVFINFLGYGIAIPVLPLLTRQYGGNSLVSGLLIASFSVVQFFAMPVMGRLSDRYGRKPLLLVSLWGTIISFAMMGITRSIFWLFVARIVDGASGGNLSIAQAYMADNTDKKDRSGGMGIIAAGISLGFILGPIWGGLFSQISLPAPFIAAVLLTLASAVLTQFFLPESVSKKETVYEKKHFDVKKFISDAFSPKLMILYIIYMLLIWAQSGLNTTMTLFADDILKISISQISLIIAFGGLVSAVIQGFAIKKTVGVVGEKKLFIISGLISVFSYLILNFASNIPLYFLGATFLFVSSAFQLPVINGLVSEKSSRHEQGGNLGIMQSFGSLGRIIGPIAGGYIYSTVNPYSPALMGAGALAIALLLGLLI